MLKSTLYISLSQSRIFAQTEKVHLNGLQQVKSSSQCSQIKSAILVVYFALSTSLMKWVKYRADRRFDAVSMVTTV